jgi:hypothetical protein
VRRGRQRHDERGNGGADDGLGMRHDFPLFS